MKQNRTVFYNVVPIRKHLIFNTKHMKPTKSTKNTSTIHHVNFVLFVSFALFVLDTVVSGRALSNYFAGIEK